MCHNGKGRGGGREGEGGGREGEGGGREGEGGRREGEKGENVYYNSIHTCTLLVR